MYEKQTVREHLQNVHVNLPVKLTISGSNKTYVEIAKTIAINLKDIGFDLEVENLENSLFFQRIKRGFVQIWPTPWVDLKISIICDLCFQVQCSLPKEQIAATIQIQIWI